MRQRTVNAWPGTARPDIAAFIAQNVPMRPLALLFLAACAILYFGDADWLRLTNPSSGSSLNGAAQPALSGIKNAASGILN